MVWSGGDDFAGFYNFGHDDGVDFVCAHCSTTLAKGLGSAQEISGVYFQCPKCRRWNRTRT